jgi:hypothetical protein
MNYNIIFTGFTETQGLGDECNRLHELLEFKLKKFGLAPALIIDFVKDRANISIYNQWVYIRSKLKAEFNANFISYDLNNNIFYYITYNNISQNNIFNLFKSELAWTKDNRATILSRQGMLNTPFIKYTPWTRTRKVINDTLALFDDYTPTDEIIISKWQYTDTERKNINSRDAIKEFELYNAQYFNLLKAFNKKTIPNNFDSFAKQNNIDKKNIIGREAKRHDNDIVEIWNKVTTAKAIIGAEGGMWHLSIYTNTPFIMILSDNIIDHLDNLFIQGSLRFLNRFHKHYNKLGFVFYSDLINSYKDCCDEIRNVVDVINLYRYKNTPFCINPKKDKVNIFNKIENILNKQYISLTDGQKLC